MKMLKKCFVLCFVLLFAACSLTQVKYDYDPYVNLTEMRSFDWLEIPSKNIRYDMTEKQVKKALMEKVLDRGFVMDTVSPDFIVAIHGEITSRWGYSEWTYIKERYEPYWKTRMLDAIQYNEGVLIIDFIDSSTKELFFRGTASDVIDSDQSPEKRAEKINEAINKILDKYSKLQAE